MRPGWLKLRACAAGVLVLAQLTVGGSATRASDRIATGAAPPTARLAFTDDRDELVTVGGTSDGGSCTDCPKHRGEASVTQIRNFNGTRITAKYESFVSTEGGDADGEVWVALPLTTAPGSMGVPQPLTCGNDSVETHPVVSPDGTKVAYASNRSGNFDIWIQAIPATGTFDCATLPPPVQLTSQPGDDLWPTWIQDAGNSSTAVAFSSTRTDPLGDIYLQAVGSPDVAGSPSAAHRITNDPGAETQPASVRFFDQFGNDAPRLFFTTTRYRPDGSLAVMAGPPDTGGPFDFTSPWPDSPPPQSSEAAPSRDAEALLFTTTEDDPYGDVRAIGVVLNGSLPNAELDGRSTPVAAQPGVAESHGAWLDAAPGVATRWIVTRRAIDADIADTIATNGSDRRTLSSAVDTGVPARTLDESSPTYAPDGRIAYSRATPDVADPGREIVTAAPDGSGVAPLVDGRSARDVDLRPAWSPDGTRIAFVRIHWNGDGYDPARIFVADLANGTTTKVSTFAPPVAGSEYTDEDPAWSPDGRRLAITRSIAGPADVSVTLAPTARTIFTGDNADLTATVHNAGPGSAADTVLRFTIPAGLSIARFVPIGCSASGDTVTCPLDKLASGATSSIDISLTGNAAGSFDVRATASSNTNDPDSGNNTATAQVTVAPRPDLQASVSAIGGTGSASLTGTVQNVGAGPAGPSEFQFSFPGMAADTTLPAGCVATGSGTAQGVLCQVPGLAAGASAQFGFKTFAGQGNYRIDVMASVSTGEVNVANNDASTTVQVSPPGPHSAHIRRLQTPAHRWAGNRKAPDSGTTRLLTGPTRHGSAPSRHLAAPILTIQRATQPGTQLTDPDVQIWAIDAETGAGARLTVSCPSAPCTRITGREPAWSPDGLRIAFVDHGAVKIATLVDADSNGVADIPETATPTIDQVTGLTGAGTTASPFAPTPSRAIIETAEDPAWSPDGTEIAIAAQPAGQPDQRGVYAIKPDGTGLRTIAQLRGPETEPAWQPYTDVGVTITATPSSILQGQPTTLTATVFNLGPMRVVQATLTVTLPAGLSVTALPTGCTQVGDTVTCTLLTVKKGTPETVQVGVTGTTDGKDQLVTATVTGESPDPDPTNNTASTTVTVRPFPDLGVVIAAVPATIVIGDTTEVTATAVNPSGEDTARGVTLTVELPAGLTVTTPPTGCTLSVATITCELGDLPPGSSTPVTFTATGSALGPHVVTATVTSNPADPNPANNTASTTVTVKNGPDVAVGIVAVPGTFPQGTTTTVTAKVTNPGPESARGASLAIALATGLTVTAAPAGCTLAAATITCPLGTLPPGSVAVTFPATGSALGAHTVTATITSDTSDPNPANNTASTTVHVIRQTTDVAVSVHLSQPIGYVGGHLTATLKVTNRGPFAAVNVALSTTYTDLLQPRATAACAAGNGVCSLGTVIAGGSKTFTVALTPRRTGTPPHGYPAGVTARVSSTTPDPVPANNAATAKLTVKQPTIRLLPAIGPPGFVSIAFGENFPPRALITLVWKPGITSYGGTYKIAADGTVRAQMLVVRADQLGVRVLVARSANGLFTPVSGPMLVVPRTESPPDFLGRK